MHETSADAAAHDIEQPPQFFGSAVVSEHPPGQDANGAEHGPESVTTGVAPSESVPGNVDASACAPVSPVLAAPPDVDASSVTLR
jgi:hypothetical protein